MKYSYKQLIDLKLAKIRLKTLEDIKVKLLELVTSCTSQLKETVVEGGFSNDTFDKYIIKLEDTEEEIEFLKVEISILEKNLEEMKTIIKNSNDDDARIFNLYYFEGTKPKQIAGLIPCDLSTVYRKIEKINEDCESCKKMQILS